MSQQLCTCIVQFKYCRHVQQECKQVDHFKECKLVMQVGTFNKKVSTVVHFKEGKLLCK